MIKENKKTVQASATTKGPESNLFSRENYMWMIAGVIVIVIGFLLMAGGKSNDPKVFDADSVYSARRITVAPILIICGFIIEIIGIMKKSKTTEPIS